jgi:hypothetical protein
MYFVHIAATVETYVLGIEQLPDVRRQEILQACLLDLAQNADHFLEQYPVAHEALWFSYEYVFVQNGLIYTFRFVMDGREMSVGVVQVVYVDHETMPVP